MDDNTRDIKNIEEQIKKINNKSKKEETSLNKKPIEENTSDTIRIDKIADIKKQESISDNETKKIDVIKEKKEPVKKQIKEDNDSTKDINIILYIIIAFFILIISIFFALIFI